MRSGLRFCATLAVIDAHAAGQTDPVQVQRVGPDLVFSLLWDILAPAAPARSTKYVLDDRCHEQECLPNNRGQFQ
jgi:hypothetical protein